MYQVSVFQKKNFYSTHFICINNLEIVSQVPLTMMGTNLIEIQLLRCHPRANLSERPGKGLQSWCTTLDLFNLSISAQHCTRDFGQEIRQKIKINYKGKCKDTSVCE